MIPKVPYQFQVVAREDKGPVLGVDYNKSPRIEFKTSSRRDDSNFVPPKETDIATQVPPQPDYFTTPSSLEDKLEERGPQGVVFNGLTIELLAVIVVGGFIVLIILIGIVYKCFRTKSVSTEYSDPEDAADDLPDLSDREDFEAGEADDLKPHRDTEL